MKIVAVIPAYNVEKTLDKTLAAIPSGVVDEVIVVNDGSRDETAAIAERHGVILVNHPVNQGYGAAQKTGYQTALQRGADVAVMLHADFQYDPTLLPGVIQPLIEGKADVCFGSRMSNRRSARAGGMPLWRFVPNIVLSWIEDSVFQLGLSEYHTGYRAYSRPILERIPFVKNSDNYVFDTEMFAQIALAGVRTAEIPIPTRYFKEASSPNFWKSVQYGLSTLSVVIKFILHRHGYITIPRFVVRPAGEPAKL